ncbi:hypothetical protein LAZ67_12003633 [Cordylochernes scorpioides]|uniref:RNA-directed DNA polymerase n=1 Tax=Cordylochernes scorpioides TaxID=51811 RepID=A0ABY6L4Z0_9ARAC|nr:hypothetical protein LAZ67_12003633 [Cordylochernes scorpioides]
MNMAPLPALQSLVENRQWVSSDTMYFVIYEEYVDRLLLRRGDGDGVVLETNWKDPGLQRFGYKVESSIVAASKRRLKKEETVEDYFRDKIRLLNQTSLNNVEKLKMLTDGLPLDWKNYLVTAQPKDPSHWMQIAMEIEQNNNQIRQQQRNYDPNYKDKLKHQATNITTDVKQTIADSLCIANTNFPYRFVNVEVLLNNIPVSSFIDTGSTISLMSCSLLKQHKLKLNVNDRIKIKQVGTLGSVEVFLKIHSELVRCKLHVVKNFSYPLLIGLDVAGKIGLIIDTKDKAVYVKGNECFYISPETHLPSVQQKELNQLLKENQALFSQHKTDIGRIAVQHKIHTIEHPPISCRPYRRPLAEYGEIKRQVEELSKKGLIRENQSPWAFPVVLVSKKDGSQRMCIDYRKLNAITIDDKQPLPYIQDMFDRLHNAKYFTTLDIAWGYWHVEMHPDSVEKTAFITNDGHYEFLVMPFGLKNAPSTFQRIIQHIIGNLLWNGVCNYQDDILIYSSTFKDHIELMKKIFDKLKENNIKLKLKKCSFAKQEIRYLGHIIGHNKIKPDPEKTKAINEFPQPKTVKQVRQFLGLAGYYRKFIPKFSQIADPLTSLTRKNKLFKWTTEVNKSFQELKSHLSTDPVLSTYDPSLPCKLYTDASKLGIGAILAQIGNDNQEHVISYYSGKLLPHQQNYSAFELECFAVVQSVEYFEVYLENNTFEVITDHSALEWLFNVKKPKAKYLRWIIELSTKSMKIVHRSGSKQTHVDALSRSPVSFHISIPTLRLHQQKADLSFVKNSHIHRDLIMVKHNGVLKTVVPESFQEEILKEYHDNHSHPSINKTVRLITPFYWWPNAIICIKDYVRSCKICQITKCSHKPFIGEYVAPNSDLKPLELISMDTIVIGSAANETKHKYIQVIIDHLTKFVWAFPTVTNTSQAVIQCLDKINKTVPQIKCILTDNGKNFTSKEFNKFLNEHQVQHTYSTPYHPQSNGLCEKMNDTILTKLRTNLQENPRLKWSSLLAKIVKDYNSTPHDVTGFSPNFLLFGDCAIPEFSESPHFTIENARKKAIENSAKHREKWKARHDAKHPQSSFKVGDLVLRKIASNDPSMVKTSPKDPSHTWTGKGALSQTPLSHKVTPSLTYKSSPYRDLTVQTVQSSNDATGLSVPQQETTFEEEETSPPQGTSADPLTQIADALNKLLVARSPREIDVSPYDGTFEAQSFFDNFDAQADRAKLTYTDRLRKLPCYLQSKPLQYFRNLRLDRLFYIDVRQTLIDLFPTATEASFSRFLAIKLTPQMPLEDYYQNKTVMGMKLNLPADILIDSLTEGLPVADQRLFATVQPNTIKEWFDLVSRIRRTQCATSAVYQRQVDKAPHPTYHNPPPRHNNQRSSRVTYQVAPPPSPCKYCNAMHWHSQCEQRFQQDRTRQVYSARPRTATVPKSGTRPKVQSRSPVPQVQDDSTSPASNSTFTKWKQDLCPTQPRETAIFTTFPSNQSCLHVADPTPIICSPTIVSPTISPTHDIEISIPSNATHQLEHCPHELHRILYEFSHVFSTNKYNVPKLNIPPVKINTTTDKIIALRPYRVPLHDQQEIQTQIEQVLQHGIIAPSVSPYASPITLVTKRDKTKRFCIDYRKLNEIIAPDVHPLPLIETILDKLSKAKYYSSVDIASAYWQVEVEPNSRNLLAFVTLDSQYEFCRLPYGFKNSPQIYHRAINQVMQKYKLNFVTHYFDDFIIFSDTLEDHLQHLQQFLTVCQHENIKLNYNKCSFFKTNIDFLGYTVTAGTYAPQTRNLDTISAIKPPTNQKTLQSFLGAVNVYNKFIPDYPRLRALLNKLLKKDVKWNWDPDCQQAFTTLKESLTSKPVLHLYQVGLPCRLYCDASTQGIAGILKQVHPDGRVHPVQYFSRALRAHERNYTVSELECLAIVESVDKFRIYLTGIKFTIYTDHQALQWLKTIKNPSGRLFRWSLRLSTYNYEIHYLKGSQQYEADLLSRNPFVGFVSADIIKQHQPTASPFNIDTNGLHTITRKGVIKIIIPETLQHTLMNKVHQEYNHPGISQMTRIITAQYYWKGISKSIEKFVKSCHTCQIIKRPKGKPYGALGQIPSPQQPFDLISIDTIAGFSKYGHSKTYLHVIVDHLTRYAWTFPSKSTSTLTYIQTLKTVLQQGSPKRLLSDRAPAFTSEKFRKFLITHGIQPLLTTSNNPQANGLIERLNATITGKLRLAYLENPKASWTQLVKRVTQTYNNTPHSVTSFPPTYLMFNVIPPDLRTHLDPYPEINIAREIANSRTQNKHKKDKETFDKQHRTPHFEVNDLVLVKNYRHPDTGKLAPYFTGPYKIIEIISPNVVRIDRPNQPLNRDSDTIHVNKLKYYTENVLYITPPQTRFAQNPQRLSQDVYFSEFNHLTPDIFETQLDRIIPPTSSHPFLHLNPGIFK